MSHLVVPARYWLHRLLQPYRLSLLIPSMVSFHRQYWFHCKIWLLGWVLAFSLVWHWPHCPHFRNFGRYLLTVLTAVFSPLPGIAILPLTMLWFGLSPAAIIFVVVFGAVWPISANTDTGFRTIGTTTRMVALNLGLSRIQTVRDVFLPAALPHILSGLRLAWAFGWRTVVGAEIVFGVAGSNGGLGWYINNARYFLNPPAIFAGLVVISLLGVLLDTFFLWIERQTVVKWGMKQAQ